ncbi:MAG: hypothetical protein MJZ13_03230 [Bacteroidales bacterium]|nr:hypothetical protein [Bacteroidales bacterium]
MMKSIIYSILICAFPVLVHAQQDTIANKIERDVEVVNNYLPTISNPYKLQVDPVIDDTMSYKATFKYEVLNKVETVKTKPDSLQVATMDFKPEQMPYNAWVKGGVGNYGSFIGQLVYNIGTNEKYHLNVDLGNSSALGKVKLHETDKKVKAPTTNTWISTNYAKFYNKIALDADLKFLNYTYKHYGFQSIDTTLNYFNSTNDIVNGESLATDIKQRQTSFDIQLGFNNRLVDPRDKFSFGARAGFGYFGNKTGVTERDIHFNGYLRFPIKTNYLFDIIAKVNNSKINVDDDYEGSIYSSSPNGLSTRKHTDITLTPHFGIDFDHISLRAGLNFVLDFGGAEDNFYYQPDIYADFNVSDGAASLYLGLTGGYRANTFREVAKINPWVSSDSYDRAWVQETGQYDEIQTTQTPIKLTAGVRAKIAHVVAFDIAAEYESFDDEVFFVNKKFLKADTTTTKSYSYTNMFEVINENGKVGRIKGELSITPTAKTQVILKGTYYKWKLNYLEEPWYKPNYEAGVDVRFFWNDKLLIKAGVNSVGARYAYNPEKNSKEKLDMILDINMGAEYRINSRWTAFLDCNNLAAQDYRKWLGYSSHRVNVLGGITFKF